MWALSSDERARGPLVEHLGVLLDVLEPKRDTLAELAADGFDLDWFCFVSVDAMGGVTLGVELLRRLAALPVELTLDIYG
jgi:hypothetical protein